MAAPTKKTSPQKPQSTTNKRKSPAKAKLISSKLSYKGKVFSVFTDTVLEPSGSTNVRDVIRHNGSVVFLAVDESKTLKTPTSSSSASIATPPASSSSSFLPDGSNRVNPHSPRPSGR